MFHKELQLRAPNILQVIASAVCDVPVKVEDKKFAHILHSVASVLHGRSAEMSSLHYQIGFILAHGGCTQRVSVFLRKPKTYSLIKFRSSICSSFFFFFNCCMCRGIKNREKRADQESDFNQMELKRNKEIFRNQI